MKKLFYITFFTFLSLLPAFGIDGLRFESITTKDGLSQNTIRCMLQDSRGFMWFGTFNGLNRYDGREFIVMLPEFGVPSLKENRIKNLVEDHNGGLWVQTNSDFMDFYNSRSGAFVDYLKKNTPHNYKNIMVAKNGDIWLWGTQNGCCRVKFENGQPETTFFDKDNINSNITNFVFECPDNTIWIGTDKGLVKYAEETISFRLTANDDYNYHSVIEMGKNIYFFTHNNKVIVFDKLKKSYLYDININAQNNLKINNTAALDDSKILITTRNKTFILDINSSKTISAESYFQGHNPNNAYLITDNKKNVWIYNKSGNIWQYRNEDHQFRAHKLIPETILPQIDLERYAIHHDSRNIIWITTYGNGLFAFDQNTGIANHYTESNSDLRSDYLLSITEDQSGEIWVGTEHAGIIKISLTNYNNKVFYPDKNKLNTANKIIRTVWEDRNGDIWVGTKSGNIYIVDKDLENKQTVSLHKGMPYAIAEDTTGNKWIGTKGGGVMIFPADRKSAPEIYVNNPADIYSLSNDNIYAILCDSKGRMWLGTFGEGLLLCERRNGKLQFKKFPSISSVQYRMRCLIQDSSGTIWIGGNNGVTLFNPDEILKDATAYTNLSFDNNDPESLNNSEVKTIFEDSHGRIWLGTSGGGLNLAIKGKTLEKTIFKHYSSEEGLINNVVQAILEDDENNLWISTEGGISKFNTKTNIFENISFSNNWEGDLFCEASCFKRKNGELMFGSYDGLYIFNPASLENSSYIPPVTITGLKINGNIVSPNDPGSPLKISISETRQIKLRHNQNSFNIEFASLNFHDSYSNRYTYILENYEKTWNPITNYNVATYRNIPIGKYVFKVKGCNSSGVWNETITELEVIVVPPFWKSSQAIALYLLLSIVICFFAAKLIIRMNQLHNAVEVEKQLTDYRLRFFTNISHEFRTPLTIIRGTIESLTSIDSIPPIATKHIKTLDKSSNILMRLIDQLLEFRRLQNNKMELKLEKTETVGFFNDIYNIFRESAEKKKIDFRFISNKESYEMLLDKGKMDKIAYNLLSNAFKYTPEEGKINMEIFFDTEKDLFSLRVSDSGIGIPKEKQSMLFIRFNQINYSSSGTGIGLHLTSELAGVHKGNIQYVESELGGAGFLVTIPLSDRHYDSDDIIATPATSSSRPPETEENPSEEILPRKTLKNYNVLVVEDDEGVRAFLKDQLGEYFTVSTAENGLQGLEKAMKEQPNLIVCDVMMPEMDGFEVTRRLKTEFQTCHIPVILLTAHSSQDHQMEGIEAGADAYITKPFSMKYLKTRIIKLMEQRETLQQKFAKEPGLLSSTIYTTDKDMDFLEKIHQIIENNIDNPEFNVDQFALSANLGRTVFYKKIKGITGYSPNEYLRVMRMKKAAELLTTTNLNVSEISYRVGINDPFYFSKCFKAQFGKSPSQFVKSEEQ